IPFALPIAPAMGEDDFLVTPSNREASALIGQASGTLLLLGPKGSGKSHLARIWMKRLEASLLDFEKTLPDELVTAPSWLWEDADQAAWDAAAEEKAFHLLNSAREGKIPLLITATAAPALWPLNLADVRSRLLALPVAQLHAPDDALMAGLLLKHLNDRQLKVSEEVLNYLLARLPREGARLEEAVQRLDRASLADRRAITIPLARDILKDFLAANA
ncbi:MAG TPA: DnaA/Hda family protein, partial [Alphaproteobacteria bacterium]|nr:DnaA/Hda family protein [Alphaproteobacteria bacterium]